MNLKPSSSHLLLTCLITLFTITYSNSAFSKSNEVYSYRIKVNGVTDPVAFKELSQYLDEIFDSRARFDDSVDEITIFSMYDVPNNRLSMKLTALGYTLVTYTQTVDINEPK